MRRLTRASGTVRWRVIIQNINPEEWIAIRKEFSLPQNRRIFPKLNSLSERARATSLNEWFGNASFSIFESLKCIMNNCYVRHPSMRAEAHHLNGILLDRSLTLLTLRPRLGAQPSPSADGQVYYLSGLPSSFAGARKLLFFSGLYFKCRNSCWNFQHINLINEPE